MESYASPHTPVLEAASDSARTFEFLRDYFADAEPRRIDTPFGAILREALNQLLQRYPGGYNFLLTNGQVIWAFTNHRPIHAAQGQ